MKYVDWHLIFFFVLVKEGTEAEGGEREEEKADAKKEFACRRKKIKAKREKYTKEKMMIMTRA